MGADNLGLGHGSARVSRGAWLLFEQQRQLVVVLSGGAGVNNVRLPAGRLCCTGSRDCLVVLVVIWLCDTNL